MTIEVLLCTTAPRLHTVAQVLLPPRPGVRYLVSCQQLDDAAWAAIRPAPGVYTIEGGSSIRSLRPDVAFLTLPGRGLSRNRNHALAHATGDLLLLADDDEQLLPDTLDAMPADFAASPQCGILLYEAEGSGKRYPADYVSSWEVALRHEVARSVRFDERFGLGSAELACGEEELFVWEARRRGYGVGRMPRVVCRVEGETTGRRFLRDPRVQRSKGALLAVMHGPWRALLLCLREAASYSVRYGANPFPLLRHMLWGIRYVRD